MSTPHSLPPATRRTVSFALDTPAPAPTDDRVGMRRFEHGELSIAAFDERETEGLLKALTRELKAFLMTDGGFQAGRYRIFATARKPLAN